MTKKTQEIATVHKQTVHRARNGGVPSEDVLSNKTTCLGEVLESVPHVARVEVGAGATVNVGEYESLRADVRISIPCSPTEEMITEAYNRASYLASKYLEAETDAGLAEVQKRRGYPAGDQQ